MSDVSTATSDTVTIITVSQLLSDTSLCIPDYQRPYKWTSTNIDRLLDDVAEHLASANSTEPLPEYRLGTIVLYRKSASSSCEIVDGQQRYLSLLLITHALLHEPDSIRTESWQETGTKTLSNLQEAVTTMLDKLTFPSEYSHQNIAANYAHIQKRINAGDINARVVYLLLTRCTLVRCLLEKMPEAFQFFDAQNARGKPLQPHDLLKAFHLRELQRSTPIGIATAENVDAIVQRWEAPGELAISELFARYLARIRHWQRGNKSSTFRREDIGLFKGFTPGQSNAARYSLHWQLIERQRSASGSSEEFPSQLDQPIVNGQRFFEWVEHYFHELTLIKNAGWQNHLKAQMESVSAARAASIFKAIDSYEARGRTGDGYVRELFNAFLLAYMDRFGEQGLPDAVEAGFVWAWSLRLSKGSVQWASIENYVKELNPFLMLRDATSPAELLRAMQPSFDGKLKVASTRTEEIRALFPKGVCRDD